MDKRAFMCFPNFKRKALTLSYDDGVKQDKNLLQIMKQHGLKGTFNINYGLFNNSHNLQLKDRLTKEEAVELFNCPNAEIAVHGYNHLSLLHMDNESVIKEVINDKAELEKLFKKEVFGMAYAYGDFDERVIEIVKSCGINYSRTTDQTENFDLPKIWLQWDSTCHHNNPKLMHLAKRFIEDEEKESTLNSPKMFYMWGHSYEFDNDNNWKTIENFATFIGNRKNVWYATNGEIYQYVSAFDNLEWSFKESCVFNPSKNDIFINFFGKQYIIEAGKKVKLENNS